MTAKISMKIYILYFYLSDTSRIGRLTVIWWIKTFSWILKENYGKSPYYVLNWEFEHDIMAL